MSDPLDELEALTDGLASPFWVKFVQYANQEWGPSGLRYQQAVRDAAEKGAGAVVELQKVLYAHEAIRQLMSWPRDRHAHLKGQAMAHLVAERRAGTRT